MVKSCVWKKNQNDGVGATQWKENNNATIAIVHTSCPCCLTQNHWVSRANSHLTHNLAQNQLCAVFCSIPTWSKGQLNAQRMYACSQEHEGGALSVEPWSRDPTISSANHYVFGGFPKNSVASVLQNCCNTSFWMVRGVWEGGRGRTFWNCFLLKTLMYLFIDISISIYAYLCMLT